jgi:hypothetical protein
MYKCCPEPKEHFKQWLSMSLDGISWVKKSSYESSLTIDRFETKKQYFFGELS